MDGPVVGAAAATIGAAAAGATLWYCCTGADPAPTPASATATAVAAADGPRRLVVVGTGAERDAEDKHKWVGLSSVLLFSLGADGSLRQEFELPDVGVNPMFMCSRAGGALLDAVNMGETDNAASLQTFAVDHAARSLAKLGEVPTADGPCHLTTVSLPCRDVFGAPSEAQIVLVANYGAGGVAAHIAKEDGTLGAASCAVQHGPGATPGVGRQDKAHPHGVCVSPDGKFVFVADLGRNSVFMYALRADGQLAELAEQVVHAGAGPRHLAATLGVGASPYVAEGVEIGVVFCLNELDNTISVM